MFDVNEQKQQWRDSLRRTGVPHESLAELEVHLDDTMAELAEKGLTEEESFLIASRRIGPVDLLGGEYRKERTRGSRSTLVKGMLAFIAFCVIWTGMGLVFQPPLIVQVFPFTILPVLAGLARFVRDESRRILLDYRTNGWKRFLEHQAFWLVVFMTACTIPVVAAFSLVINGHVHLVTHFWATMAAVLLFPITTIGLMRIIGEFFERVRSASPPESGIAME